MKIERLERFSSGEAYLAPSTFICYFELCHPKRATFPFKNTATQLGKLHRLMMGYKGRLVSRADQETAGTKEKLHASSVTRCYHGYSIYSVSNFQTFNMATLLP